MEGWRAEVGRGSFLPQKPFLQTSFSTETGVVQWGPRSGPQIRIPSPASGGLSSPGSTRKQGPRNSETKIRGLGIRLAGAAESQFHYATTVRSLPYVWFMLLDETSFFFSLSLYTFWILLWNFFLLGLFLGQCSPDIWFTVNSIDCIGLSQEMEEIAFSFFLSAGWQVSLCRVGQALWMRLTWPRVHCFVPPWLEGDGRWEGIEQRVAS